ncbi:hypothetical protein M1558_04245 [Candidatus Parvarchaeota archaeon]|nr:hypothetical protein [Candidatus Parvarchaeota archaeon]
MNSEIYSIALLIETIVILLFGLRIFIKLKKSPETFLSKIYLGYKGKLPLTFIFLLLGAVSILAGFLMTIIEFLINNQTLFWEYPTLAVYFFLALFFITFIPSIKIK